MSVDTAYRQQALRVQPCSILGGISRRENIAEREDDEVWDAVCDCAPNMKGKMIRRYIHSPPRIERVIGRVSGDVTLLEISMDQMFAFRPAPRNLGLQRASRDRNPGHIGRERRLDQR